MREMLSYSFLMPPTIFIALCLAGAFITLFYPRAGTKLVFASSILLYLFATPAASGFLVRQLVSPGPTDAELIAAQAIVVPGADTRFGDGASVPDTVGLLTLDRLASAAELYRRLHVPIVVSGGKARDNSVPLADLMRHELEQNFLVPVTYEEDKSHTTYENALYSSKILREHNIFSAIIVVQDLDAARVAWSFQKFGIQPTVYMTHKPYYKYIISDFVPSSQAMLESFYASHEIIGLLYYKFLAVW
jgi:uncharacterized SAM-binding protein YcdF (DUF218 family)